MSYLIAAAGTGGHVFPGLSVAEALLDRGVPQEEILFVGGDRLEANVYPEAGYPFLQVEMRGLQRRPTLANLALPAVVWRARDQIREAIVERGVRVALGMGGYITVPAALAALTAGAVFMNAEQNAEAGLANRIASRWAKETFVAFPGTGGLPGGRWVGNPVRREFWDFDRDLLRPKAMTHYGLRGQRPVLGVVGGSLGARILNTAIAEMMDRWNGPEIAVLHLTGPDAPGIGPRPSQSDHVTWVRIGFEAEMALFYAACDLVVARAGGAVAELTATGTPAVLVPGGFGSRGHQRANARFLTSAGAAVTVPEEGIDALPDEVASLLENQEALAVMRESAATIARPKAALSIAMAMMEAAA